MQDTTKTVIADVRFYASRRTAIAKQNRRARKMFSSSVKMNVNVKTGQIRSKQSSRLMTIISA